MPNEIEHKYLVRRNVWKPSTPGVLYRKGYLSSATERVVRVRIAGDKAYLTVKGITTGVTPLEFEYAIPIADATTMLDKLCEQPLIEKTRYREEFQGHVWEVDELHGDNAHDVRGRCSGRYRSTTGVGTHCTQHCGRFCATWFA